MSENSPAPSDEVNAKSDFDGEDTQGETQSEAILTTGPVEGEEIEEEDDGLEEQSDDVAAGDDAPGEDPPTNEPSEG